MSDALSYDQMLLIARIAVWIIVIAWWLFIVMYVGRSNWRETRAGKGVVYSSISTALAWSVTLYFSYYPPESIFTAFVVQMIAFVLTIAAVIYLTYALIFNQYFDRRRNGQRT